MPRSSSPSIPPRNVAINRRSDLQIVLLQEHEMPVALDPDVGELDPLIIGNAHLLKVLDETVVVRCMRARLARDHDIRYFAELGELVDSAGLQNA